MPNATTVRVLRSTPDAALRRYEAMCGCPRQLSARAWRAIAIRLEMATRLVSELRAPKFADRTLVAWLRADSAMAPVRERVWYGHGQVCVSYAVDGPRATSLHRGVRQLSDARAIAKRLGDGHVVSAEVA